MKPPRNWKRFGGWVLHDLIAGIAVEKWQYRSA
jgi:hypothetical protein